MNHIWPNSTQPKPTHGSTQPMAMSAQTPYVHVWSKKFLRLNYDVAIETAVWNGQPGIQPADTDATACKYQTEREREMLLSALLSCWGGCWWKMSGCTALVLVISQVHIHWLEKDVPHIGRRMGQLFLGGKLGHLCQKNFSTAPDKKLLCWVAKLLSPTHPTQ